MTSFEELVVPNKLKKQFENAERFERPPPLPLRRESALPTTFPVKALGRLLSDAVAAIVDKVQCPEAVAAQSVLGASALAAQSHANVVHPATGDERPLSLFLITVAASGERKSAADKFALSPVRLREAELYERHQSDQRTFKNSHAAYESAREAIIRKNKGNMQEIRKGLEALGPPPTSPLVPLLTAPDPTLEGLHKLLAVGEPSMGLFSDEGGTFIGGYGMSEEAKLRTGSGLSDMWDSKPVKRVRGGDGVTILRGRRLSMHLMVQPGIADALLSDPTLKQQGLVSRLLVSEPRSIVGERLQKPIKRKTEPALKRYDRRLLELLRRPTRFSGITKQELCPQALLLSKTARQSWCNFADECERELAQGKKFEAIRGFANKLPEHALRIAAVLHVIDGAPGNEINNETVIRAIQIARYYAEEALRLFERGASSIEIQRAEKVLHWLRESWGKETVGLSHVYQFGPNSIREAALAREAMDILERHHWVFPLAGGAKIEGRYHREAWQVVPI